MVLIDSVLNTIKFAALNTNVGALQFQQRTPGRVKKVSMETFAAILMVAIIYISVAGLHRATH
jgi:hypothetical protein